MKEKNIKILGLKKTKGSKVVKDKFLLLCQLQSSNSKNRFKAA
jgi:hypothetical protein